MPSITFISAAGNETIIDLPVGYSVMEAATHNDVPGIIGECLGSAACGTCHVYVEPEWIDRLPAPSVDELEMLALAIDPRPNSRLSCQIRVDTRSDGLRVYLPERQI
tara:strand:+ start:850 stop:1170 length:321 start_codon:yes stop_codon:yes gene_type:complete